MRYLFKANVFVQLALFVQLQDACNVQTAQLIIKGHAYVEQMKHIIYQLEIVNVARDSLDSKTSAFYVQKTMIVLYWHIRLQVARVNVL